MYIIEKEEIDLFFIEMNIKQKSGLTLSENIRKIEKYELTPIVFISKEIDYIITAFKKVNCYDFLSKPISVNNIKKIIDKFLRHKNKITNESYNFF